MSKKQKKSKKQRVIYIDDGSSVADMSGTVKSPRGKSDKRSSAPRSTFRECFQTYTDAVRMMFLPMLAVLGIMALAFIIIYILL